MQPKRFEYSVYLCADDGAIEWQSARKVESTSHADAAKLAFTLSPPNSPARCAFRMGKLATAWVWREDHPKHPNGAPICVHKLSLERGKTMEQVA